MEEGIYKRRAEREKKARKEAEKLLEEKSLALYQANEELRKLNTSLEEQVKLRTDALRETELKYTKLVDQASDIIYQAEPYGHFTYVNPVTCRILGFDEKELLGLHFTELVKEGHRERVRDFYRHQFEQREVATYLEFPVLTRHGKEVWLGQNVQFIIERKRIKEIFAVARDITERVLAQQQLEEARKAAEKAKDAEKNFLAHISHEIRTPLNAIIGMSHLLFDTQPNPVQTKYLETIQYSTNLLMGIISDVLDMSKIEAGEIEVDAQPFHLGDMVRALEQTFLLKLKEKPVTMITDLESKLDREFIGDPTLINQLCINLLGNAAKFTARGHIRLEVKLRGRQQDHDQLQFMVEDTGTGIPEEKLGHIFDRFKQADSEVRSKYGGSGLGLAICKKIVELMGGSIWVESEPGKGSRFYFILPLKKATGRPVISRDLIPKQVPGKEENLDGLRVLVVEDNQANQMYISRLLEKWGIQYTIAGNGLEGVKCAQEEPFDLIFMDIQMPVMNGHEAALRIRAASSSPNKDIPIIALTASAFKGDKQKTLDSGMNDFLTKPFAPQKLKTIIGNYCEVTGTSNCSKKEEFYFDPRLDVGMLTSLYEEDYEHAEEIFALFLDNIPTQVRELEKLVGREQFAEAANLAHKIKPSFAMVGIPGIGGLFDTLILHLRNEPLEGPLNKLIKHFWETYTHYLPIVEDQWRQIVNYTKPHTHEVHHR